MSRYIDADIYVTAKLYDDEHEEYRDERMTIADCLDRFTDEGCPTEVKPKQGEWIDTEERETLIGSIDGKTLKKYRLPKCSLCGKEFGTPAYKYRFCPNCGERMKGADDEEST